MRVQKNKKVVRIPSADVSTRDRPRSESFVGVPGEGCEEGAILTGRKDENTLVVGS